MLTPIDAHHIELLEPPDSPTRGGFTIRVGNRRERMLSYNGSWSDLKRTALFGWRDSPDWAGGNRKPTLGFYVACLRDQVIYAGHLPRPFYGSITPHGAAAIVDEGLEIDVLGCDVWVLTPRGKPVRHIHLRSNGSGVAFSHCARFLLVSLCNGDEGDGHAMLILFDVVDGHEMWRLRSYASARYARIDSKSDTITIYRPRPVDEFLQRRIRLSKPSWIDKDFIPADPKAPWAINSG